MATVTGMTAARAEAIEAAAIVSGTIDASGHLILTKHDGSTYDAGPVLAATSETYTWDGSAYTKVTTRPRVFIGPNDPSLSTTVPEGSLWFSNP